jgi:hypothetical protein
MRAESRAPGRRPQRGGLQEIDHGLVSHDQRTLHVEYPGSDLCKVSLTQHVHSDLLGDSRNIANDSRWLPLSERRTINNPLDSENLNC